MATTPTTLPYDDNAMIYDYDEHRYILLTSYVLDKTGIDLSKCLNVGFSSDPQRLAEFVLNQISSEIYGWIYAHNRNNVFQEYLLAKNEDLRVYLRNAMLQQVMYVLKNGDLNEYSGINVKNGQITDQTKMIEASISPNAKRELNRIIPKIEIAITYEGQIVTPFNFEVRGDY